MDLILHVAARIGVAGQLAGPCPQWEVLTTREVSQPATGRRPCSLITARGEYVGRNEEPSSPLRVRGLATKPCRVARSEFDQACRYARTGAQEMGWKVQNSGLHWRQLYARREGDIHPPGPVLPARRRRSDNCCAGACTATASLRCHAAVGPAVTRLQR